MGSEDHTGAARNIANMLENIKSSALETAQQQVTVLAYASKIPTQAHNHSDWTPTESNHGPRPLGEACIDDAAALQIKEELEQAFLIPTPISTNINELDLSVHTAHLRSKRRKHTREEISDESIEEMPVAIGQAQRPFAPAKKPKKDKKPLATPV